MTSLEGATDPMKDCDDKRDCAGGKLKSGEPRKKEETVAANGTVTNNKAGAEHPRKSAMKSQYESMLEEFECPISNNLPIEPVIAPDVSQSSSCYAVDLFFNCILTTFLPDYESSFHRERFTKRRQL